MCGRYTLAVSPEELALHFRLTGSWPSPEDPTMMLPRYNVAPTQEVPIIRELGAQKRRATFARWGLVGGSSASGRRRTAKTINARSETVFERPPFRTAIRSRRCLVPATGFLEWQRKGRSRLPFHIGRVDSSLFAMAGIWSEWRTSEGKDLVACSILTTGPNEKVAELHDRMPVILQEDVYPLWLDPNVAEPEVLAPLFLPFDSERIAVEPVSTRVNRVANDDPTCLSPRDPEASPKVRQLGFDF